jgi:hypothetical protein
MGNYAVRMIGMLVLANMAIHYNSILCGIGAVILLVTLLEDED